MLPVWDDNYSVHNERIDEQHKKLFELAGYAYVCADRKITKTEIKQLLTGFFNYMREHFNDEEAYMRAIGYPRLDKHHAIHEEIVEGFYEVVQTTHSTNELKEKLGIIAKNWLLQHILKEDMLIEQYRSEAVASGRLPADVDVEMSKKPKPEVKISDTQPVAKTNVDPKNAGKVQYGCDCPDKKHYLTMQVHEKIAAGKQFRCKTCSQPLRFEKLP